MFRRVRIKASAFSRLSSNFLFARILNLRRKGVLGEKNKQRQHNGASRDVDCDGIDINQVKVSDFVC